VGDDDGGGGSVVGRGTRRKIARVEKEREKRDNSIKIEFIVANLKKYFWPFSFRFRHTFSLPRMHTYWHWDLGTRRSLLSHWCRWCCCCYSSHSRRLKGPVRREMSTRARKGEILVKKCLNLKNTLKF
jgi:hypothetical protein